MRNYKKFASFAAAIVMAFGVASCGSSDSSDTAASTGDATTATTASGRDLKESQQEVIKDIATESKADDRQLTNTTIKWFSFWDINPTSSEDKDIGVDLSLFKTKYNGTIEYVQTTWENKFDDLAAKILANESPDFCGADDMDMFPKGAIKEMIEPIDDYIDFTSDLWKDIKDASDQFVYQGKHYVGISRVDPALLGVPMSTWSHGTMRMR